MTPIAASILAARVRTAPQAVPEFYLPVKDRENAWGAFVGVPEDLCG